MKQLLIKETIYRGATRVDIYNNGHYDVLIINGEKQPEIEVRGYDKYLPSISQEFSPFKKEFNLTIQTTSYGDLPVNEIQQIIDGYQIAIETVKQINDLVRGEYNRQIKKCRDCWGDYSYFGFANGMCITEAFDTCEDLIETHEEFEGVEVVE